MSRTKLPRPGMSAPVYPDITALNRGSGEPPRREGGGHPMGRDCQTRAALLLGVPALLLALARRIGGRR